MEIHPAPAQEALIREPAATGRFARPEDALALWKGRERTRAEFRATLNEAENSLARGEGIEITRRAMNVLTDSIIERTRARLAAESKVSG